MNALSCFRKNGVLLLYIVVTLISIYIGIMIAHAYLKQPKEPSTNHTTDLNTYMEKLYGKGYHPELKSLNFIWNNAPIHELCNFPIAKNTSVTYPPNKGEELELSHFRILKI